MEAMEAREAQLLAQIKAKDARIRALEEELSQLRVHSPSEAELKWPAAKVRETFINFFAQTKEHTFWPSSPVVPVDDPTLLFANAGMNQYKPLFLGTCDPSLDMAQLKRAVNSQKCIRAGGKHNDLDDVGKDVYHHTFFEMLGNWSFGSYFKKEAVAWSWECLTSQDFFGMDQSRIYATYFGGDASQGLEPDEETRQLWLQYLPAERVLPFGCKDNFWEMGDTGPCGPCTEIHYDRIGGRDAAALVNADLPDVIEIWNNVFIQFNRESDGSLRELPSKHVDTGMGFERLTSILQDKQSNYDTDVFQPIFRRIQSVTGCRGYTGKVGAEDTDNVDMAYRVVADHIRTLTFAITDGAVPSNDGRGYVLRRILRRAVRYGQQVMGAPKGFFAQLADTVVEVMGDAFPEIRDRVSLVKSVIAGEEATFNRTLDNGIKKFNKFAEENRAAGNAVITGEQAFLLYASMGFPVDLTELMAEEQGLALDRAAFERCMKEEVERSHAAEKARKGAAAGSKDMALEAEQTAWLSNSGAAPTDASGKYIWNASPTTNVLACFLGRGLGEDGVGFCGSVGPEDGAVGLVLEQTSFYAEAGGQIYDTGVISVIGSGGATMRVEDVQSFGSYVLHVGVVEAGRIEVGANVELLVDYSRRERIAPNHTMTHVLNYALRSVLIGREAFGESTGMVDQRGSAVDEHKLRFDFSWNEGLSVEQLAQVEAIVKAQIAEERDVFAYEAPLEEAKKISSLRSVFGESYPDPVRVLSVGRSVEEVLRDPARQEWVDYSIEFCGGTHLTNTREAKDFVIVEERGTAKGIRRITACTHDAAARCVAKAEEIGARVQAVEQDASLSVEELSASKNQLTEAINEAVISAVRKAELRDRVSGIVERIKKLKKEAAAARERAAIDSAVAAMAEQSGRAVVSAVVDSGLDKRVCQKVLNAMSDAAEDGVTTLVLFSRAVEAKRVGVYVQKKAGDVNAKEVCARIVEAGGGGKSGGNATKANGLCSLDGLAQCQAAL